MAGVEGAFEPYLAVGDIDYSRTKAKSPQTNRICGRFPQIRGTPSVDWKFRTCLLQLGGSNMNKVTFAATVTLVMLLSVAPAHALRFQIFQCGNSNCDPSGFTDLSGTLGSSTSTATISIAGSYPATNPKIVISGGSVAIQQTSSTKGLVLSGAVVTFNVAGTYLFRMWSDDGYNPQPGKVPGPDNVFGTADDGPPKKYPNAAAVDGFWVKSGTADFRNNTITVLLKANFGTDQQTDVDQAPTAATVTVQYNSDNKTFSRTNNTKTEDINVKSEGITCFDPSTNTTISTCGRNRHRKDVRITVTTAQPNGWTEPLPQTLNLGQTIQSLTATSEFRIGGRAELARDLFCPVTSSQFQFGTTSEEKRTQWFPHSPLSLSKEYPNSSPPNFKAQFDGRLASLVGTETLVSILSDTDPFNDFQFIQVIPCLTSPPVTFGELFKLMAVFPTQAFTVNGVQSDKCKGALRWVINSKDKKGVSHVVQVLYGNGPNFDDCALDSGVNMLEKGGAIFLVDGDETLLRRNQLSSLNSSIITSIQLFLDGRLATEVPANQLSPIDITVAIASTQVNNDSFSFPTQSEVAFCPQGVDHGYEILITGVTNGFYNPIPQGRISISGCKLSVNLDSATDFAGPDVYQLQVVNGGTLLDYPGFVLWGP